MRPKYWVYPYGPSNSAYALAKALGGRVIKRVGSKYQQRVTDVLINWGASHAPYKGMINEPSAVAVATSKLWTFAKLKDAGIPIPTITRERLTAQAWLQTHKVLGRDLDRGSGGRGITVYQRGSEIGEHSFYSRYFRKQREFRFHVYKDRVICVLEKLRRNGHVVDPYIRSHVRGWIFGSGHFNESPVPNGLGELARACVSVLGCDFGGVDIGWNDRDGGCVFELNTAPGLEGSTILAYKEAIQS